MTDLHVLDDPFASDFDRANPPRQSVVHGEAVETHYGHVGKHPPIDYDRIIREGNAEFDAWWATSKYGRYLAAKGDPK